MKGESNRDRRENPFVFVLRSFKLHIYCSDKTVEKHKCVWPKLMCLKDNL